MYKMMKSKTAVEQASRAEALVYIREEEGVGGLEEDMARQRLLYTKSVNGRNGEAKVLLNFSRVESSCFLLQR
jgi:hypothetical protein